MNPEAAKKLGIKPFDAADYLKTEQDCAEYLSVLLPWATLPGPVA